MKIRLRPKLVKEGRKEKKRYHLSLEKPHSSIIIGKGHRGETGK
jgi:hypothetical protein